MPPVLAQRARLEMLTADARVAAANAILDRGWGKPGQYIETSVRNKPLDEMTDEELMAIATGADSEDESETDPEQLN
jgi:hypothetical protein